MTVSTLNKAIINNGEELRNRYLYQLQDKKDIVKYLVNIFNKNNYNKNKLTKILKCL